MALTIDINANARQAQREVKDLSGALDDTADALDDLAREGKQAGDKIESTFRDMVRDAGKAEKAVGNVKDGFKKAERGADEFKSEAASTAREATASFSDVTDAVDAVQELAANAFSGFGAAGAIAGGAAAVGIGLVTAEFQKQQEEADKLKERLSGLYLEALESGRDYIDQSQFIAESNSLRFDTERADEWKKLQEDTKKLALDENTIIKANAGDLEAQAEVFRRINEAKDDGSAYYTTERDGIQRLKPEYADMENRWKATKEASDNYAQAVKDAQESESEFWQDVIANAGTASQEVDEFGNKLLTLPDGQKVLISADTGRATSNVDAFKGDVDGIPESVTTTARFTADTSRVDRELRRLDGRTLKINARFVTSGTGWD